MQVLSVALYVYLKPQMTVGKLFGIVIEIDEL